MLSNCGEFILDYGANNPDWADLTFAFNIASM